MTTENFIAKAKEVHGDKYDYSKVEYVNNKTKVMIICPIHGTFEQTPISHLQGLGCPMCKKESHTKMSTEDFIKRAKEVHGDKYDYSKVKYVNAATKVLIISPKYGEFYQTPSAHLRGQGCPMCSSLKKESITKMTTEDFISKARAIHGDKYDYSKVKYVDATTKVAIISPKYGLFYQTPNAHLQGQGCPLERCKMTVDEFVSKFK